jgi:hypothetical protein
VSSARDVVGIETDQFGICCTLDSVVMGTVPGRKSRVEPELAGRTLPIGQLADILELNHQSSFISVDVQGTRKLR